MDGRPYNYVGIKLRFQIPPAWCERGAGGGGGGGGERYLTKFNTGRLRPEVQPLTLLYTICWKKVPLSHTYFTKSCSHFHVVLNK